MRAGEQQTGAAMVPGEETARLAGVLVGWRGRGSHGGGWAGGAELRQDTLGRSARMQNDRTGATGSPSLKGARMVLKTQTIIIPIQKNKLMTGQEKIFSPTSETDT